MPQPASSWRSARGDPTCSSKDDIACRNANAATLRVIERFTRIGPDKVKWSVTLDDPTTLTKPWTFSMPLIMYDSKPGNDSQPVLEYSCHEGNYGLRNILQCGSRRREEGRRRGREEAERKWRTHSCERVRAPTGRAAAFRTRRLPPGSAADPQTFWSPSPKPRSGFHRRARCPAGE